MSLKAAKKSSIGTSHQSPVTAVGSLTSGVNGTRSGTATVRNAQEALLAADLYLGRLIPAVHAAGRSYKRGNTTSGAESLTAAIAGIHFLAELLAVVDDATGVRTSPDADQELGRIALCLHEIGIARNAHDHRRVADLVGESLVPALTRLEPTLPQLEARIAAHA